MFHDNGIIFFMQKCGKCKGRMFVDRMYSAPNHLEIFCIMCGSRKFYRNFTEKDTEAIWLAKMESQRAKQSISPL